MADSLKKNLLAIVQEILIAMDSDNVNSISDTDEATDVANIVQSVYFDLVSRHKIPETRELIQLTALADVTRPVYLQIPDSVKLVERLDYNVSTESGTTSFRELEWLDPNVFLSRAMGKDVDDSTRTVVPDINNSTSLIVDNDSMPKYFTSFDDKHIVCDSYDSSEESTLQASKTRAWVVKMPIFTLSDTFTPDLDSAHFRLLVNEAKSTCIATFNKTINPKIESQARKQRMFAQNDKYRVGGHKTFRDFGRS